MDILYTFIESWKENPDFYQYLSKLGGYDVDQLSKIIFSLYSLINPFIKIRI